MLSYLFVYQVKPNSAGWPPYGKELFAWSYVGLCNLYGIFVILVISHMVSRV